MPIPKRRAGAKPKKITRGQTAGVAHLNKPQEGSMIKDIKIDHTFPEDVALQYADNILIQHRDTMFTLNFMQMQHPILITQDQIFAVDSIESKCVSRVIVTPFQLVRYMKAIEDNFTKFLALIGSPIKDWKEYLTLMEAEEKANRQNNIK